MHVIGVFNRDGGTFRTTDMDVFVSRAEAIFVRHGHRFEAVVVDGGGLLAALEKAAKKGELLLAGGGDGTISAAAAIAYRTGVPLGVLPAGTMNLFARALGMPLDLGEALEAVAGGETRAVDIATANGRPFIHQFSVGLHAKLVKLRETLPYKSRLGKMLASTRAALGAVLRPPRFAIDLVTPHGIERRHTVGLAVSNNPLQEAPLSHSQGLDAGVLGIYIVAPLSLWMLLRLGLGILRGTWKSLPEVTDREAHEVVLRFPRRRSRDVAAIDGELLQLTDRVHLRIDPGALRVVTPRTGARQAGTDGALTGA